MTGNPSPDAWPLQADHLPSQAIEACLICFPTHPTQGFDMLLVYFADTIKD